METSNTPSGTPTPAPMVTDSCEDLMGPVTLGWAEVEDSLNRETREVDVGGVGDVVSVVLLRRAPAPFEK